MDISWFMRALKESIARWANEEDVCKGRFWEGRFRSQALLDVPASISAMAYVDLNPVRAGMAPDLEASDFTSVQERLREVLVAAKEEGVDARGQPIAAGRDCRSSLKPFGGDETCDQVNALPFSLSDYLVLCDWTGLTVRDDKRGKITRRLEGVLVDLVLDEARWQELALAVQARALVMIGDLRLVQSANDRHGRGWMAGQQWLARIYGVSAG